MPVTVNNLKELRNALWGANWRVLGKDIYKPKSSTFIWVIKHEHTEKELELDFFLNGPFGSASKDPRDIMSCTICCIDYKLYFGSIKTKEWKDDLKKFIEKLSNLA